MIQSYSSAMLSSSSSAWPPEWSESARLTALSSLTMRLSGLVAFMAVTAVMLEACMDEKQARLLRAGRNGGGSSTNRLLIPYMIGHSFRALNYMVGTTAAPKQLVDVWGAAGNVATCEAMGFLCFLGSMSYVLYDAAISLSYAMKIGYEWNEEKLWKYLERWAHLFCIGVPILVSTYGIFGDVYNYEAGICYPARFPLDCVAVQEEHGDTEDSSVECFRGRDLVDQFYFIIYSFGFVIAIISVWSMRKIYATVRKQEDRNASYLFGLSSSQRRARNATRAVEDSTRDFTQGSTLSPSPLNSSARFEGQELSVSNDNLQSPQGPSRRLSRTVAIHGFLYSGVMLVGFLPSLIISIVFRVMLGYDHEVTDVVEAVLLNVHNVLYLYIFSCRRQSMHTAYGKVVVKIFSTMAKGLEILFCCPCNIIGKYREIARKKNSSNTNKNHCNDSSKDGGDANDKDDSLDSPSPSRKTKNAKEVPEQPTSPTHPEQHCNDDKKGEGQDAGEAGQEEGRKEQETDKV